MSTAMSVTEQFAASPADVYALFTRTEFVQARMESVGGIDPKVLSITPADGDDDTSGGATVVTQQSIPASVLPSMVASMMPGDPVTERTETWSPADGGFAAEFTVVVKGAPASLKGTMRLEPSDGGSSLTVQGEATVPIPMFGAKLEGVIAEQLTTMFAAEADYTRTRLAG